ncbi:FKBP-type peptidyl-prolyl cis-trans isomerase [Sphingopyxis solisilvae]|uniref:FKBP-type peptidyl-prolyl cis-trans isomerase n=1 Tax=Sphingopyxis solisilvae TaxID=1886788 RepID=UPI001892A5DF|nr:FKBP-type peptidyl-prolyl cis-trans isomerase [Sphingopyxis solisilvae]
MSANRLSRHLLLLAASLALSHAVAASAQPTQGTAWLNRQMAALAERNGADGWQVTPSGLRWRRVAGDGTGARPDPTDVVTVHYVGTLADGSEFDSSIKRGTPTSFPLNRVIPGWQEGVALMGVGDKLELAISARLAYGPDGKGPIPGAATLLFTVELLGIEPAG